MKIAPVPTVSEENFDGLNELHNVEYHLHRGSKSKRRVKKKRTEKSKSLSSEQDILKVLKELLFGKRSLYVGVPFTLFGILLAMLLELSPLLQRYNTVVILGLSASIQFSYFPAKSVRSQLLVAIIVLLSIAIDIFQIVYTTFIPVITATVVIQIIIKLAIFSAFLRNSQGAVRTRKYLKRRFRLFIIPFHQPRRIMRDIRGRVLAIGWMELAAVFAYLLLLILFLVYLDFSSIYIGESATSYIPTFLMFKVVSSLLVLSSILYDTDWRLCLWYFGCLAWYVHYIRKYITRKRIELNGFPLVYAFSKYRFMVVTFLKLLDVCWGLYGWYIVSYTFGTKFYSIGLRMQLFCSSLVFCLVLFDLWILTLFFGIRWLLRRNRIVTEINAEAGKSYDSDDSEIEEFGLRLNLDDFKEYDQDKAQLAEMRRQLYFQRMKAEETRLAERTTDQQQHSGRFGLNLSATATQWFEDRGIWVPKRTNTVHPNPEEGLGVRDQLTTGATGLAWEDEETHTLERSGTHPLLRQLQSHAEFNNSTAAYAKYEVLWEQLRNPVPDADGTAVSPDAVRPFIAPLHEGDSAAGGDRYHMDRNATSDVSLKDMKSKKRIQFAEDAALSDAGNTAGDRDSAMDGRNRTVDDRDSVFDINWEDEVLQRQHSRDLGNNPASIVEDDEEIMSPLFQTIIKPNSSTSSSNSNNNKSRNENNKQNNRSSSGHSPAEKLLVGTAAIGKLFSRARKSSSVAPAMLPDTESVLVPVSSTERIGRMSSKATTVGVVLEKTFMMAPEEFAGIWELLAHTAVRQRSTVRVPLSIQSVEDHVVVQVPLKEQQRLLSRLLQHLRTRGFAISSAGLHDQRILEVLCNAKIASINGTAVQSIGNLGMLQIELSPIPVSEKLTAADGSSGAAAYILEWSCRCKERDYIPIYFSLLQLAELLEFID